TASAPKVALPVGAAGLNAWADWSDFAGCYLGEAAIGEENRSAQSAPSGITVTGKVDRMDRPCYHSCRARIGAREHLSVKRRGRYAVSPTKRAKSRVACRPRRCRQTCGGRGSP